MIRNIGHNEIDINGHRYWKWTCIGCL